MMSPNEQLLAWLSEQVKRKTGVFYLGICGAQGSGKSTLAQQLLLALRDQGMQAAVLSLDDLYLSRERRRQLAADVHPLLSTRGVPGTHDVAQGLALFDALDHVSVKQALALPRFDKAIDDIAPRQTWPLLTQALDVLIFEGWCVGVPPQASQALDKPLNPLEQERDADGRWRHWVNQQLAEQYPALFARLDKLIYLKIPDWNAVLRWRNQQEQQTAAGAGRNTSGLMTSEQISHFIQHYERLTRHALDCLPSTADVVRELGSEHEVLHQHIRSARR